MSRLKLPDLRRAPLGDALRWLPLLMLGVFVMLWHLFYPPAYDDFNYMRTFLYPTRMEGWYGGFFVDMQEITQTVGQALVSFKNHYLYVNGRLCHLPAYLMPLLPLWVGALVDGAVMTLEMWLLFRLTGLMLMGGGSGDGRRGAFRAVPLWYVAGGCMVAPVWFAFHDGLVSSVFFMNYHWSSLCALGFLWFWMGPERRSAAAVAGQCAVAFLAGAMHEVWGLVLIAMVGFDLLFLRRRWPRGQRLALAAALLLGVGVCSLSVSNFTRATTNSYLLEHLRDIAAEPGIMLHLPHAIKLFGAVLILSLLSRRVRRALARPMSLCWLVVFILDYLLDRLTEGGARGCTPALFAAMLLLLVILTAQWPSLRRPLRGLAVAVIVAGGAWMGAVLAKEREFARSHWQLYHTVLGLEKAVQQGRAEPPRWLPLDVPMREEQPWWCFNILYLPYDEPFYYERLSYIIDNRFNPITIFGDTTLIPGTAHIVGKGPYYVKGLPPHDNRDVRLRVTLGPLLPCVRPWRAINKPDTLVIEETARLIYDSSVEQLELEHGITPGGDTLYMVDLLYFQERNFRAPVRIDLLPPSAPDR